MIQAQNIYKKYKDLKVLNGVNINVKTAEIVSIVGASGAGKTTLLQILSRLLPEFTALENICLPAFIKKTPVHKAEKKALELLDFLGLANRAKHKPNQLSGGEQQRVAVARALINEPSVIFADEPSGNLDSKSAEQLHELFFKLREEFKQSFVIVTHNNDLADLADRKLEMKDGQLV